MNNQTLYKIDTSPFTEYEQASKTQVVIEKPEKEQSPNFSEEEKRRLLNRLIQLLNAKKTNFRKIEQVIV